MTEQSPSIAVPVRRPLVDQVIASLRGLIEAEGLQPGDRLPTEHQLTAQLQVGRSTLREAVRALSHSGLLETRQGSGTYVGVRQAGDELGLRLAKARVGEVFEVRRALEALIARSGAQRREQAHLDRMRVALDECHAHAANGELAAFIDADSRFHQAAAEATGNSVLVEIYELLRRSLSEASLAIADLVDPERANDLHEVLLRAIADGDGAAAVAATEAHLDDTVRLFEEARNRAG